MTAVTSVMKATKMLRVANGKLLAYSHRGLRAENQSAAQQIKFAKMPIRERSGSSPLRGSKNDDGVEVFITSPSRRSGDSRLRRGSLGAVEAVKQRARRDTTTSSDLSSENELDPSVFKRRQINPTRAAKASNLLIEKHKEDEQIPLRNLTDTIDEDSAEDSARSSLSSEFAAAADSGSLMDDLHDPLVLPSLEDIRPAITISPESPKKTRSTSSNTLQALPPPRPISTIQPVSLLGQAIKAKQSKPKNPVESFARLSGKGVPDPLNIRIFAPFSQIPNKPFDMPLQRNVQDSDSGEKPQVTVADAIGLSLWRYVEESLKPSIDPGKLNVNWWTLRMIEDGEVDFDFPALSRARPMVDFTSNNNRAARGRTREKPYDEFALVEANEFEYKENRALTPKYEQLAAPLPEEVSEISPQRPGLGERRDSSQNAVTSRPVASTTPKPLAALADRPVLATMHSTPRMGPPKMLKIHFTNLEASTQVSTIEATTDTYIAEVLDTVCKRWNLDKGNHILKVTGTNTVAPVDRTIESIGSRTDLDLVRRRFVGDGAIGLFGSPGSSSPNAPLFLPAETPKKGRRGAPMMHPLAHKPDVLGSTAKYKKYNVVRKQPMSFAPSHPRVLLMDEDYLHILPGEAGKTLFDTSGKTTRIPFSIIVGCKVARRHPKEFKVCELQLQANHWCCRLHFSRL